MDDKLFKYIKGQATPEEKSELLNWIDASEENRLYYKKMRELWDLSLLTADGGDKNQEEAYLRIRDKIKKRLLYAGGRKKGLPRLFITFRNIAAVAIIAVLSYQYLFSDAHRETNSRQNSIEVLIGDRAKITLPDGSIAWLNSGTKISYPENFTEDKRTVSLDGEAQFEVVKNEKVPFIVETGRYSITVLGTLFNVYAYQHSNRVETTLYKGSIVLKDENQTQLLQMEPGQKAVFNKTSRKMTLYDDIDVESAASWVTGYYSFDKTKLCDMLDRLGQYYDKEIVINRPLIATYECTGKFKVGESLEHILNVVKVTKPFKYKITEKQITIY
jgi:ferric-dicitrate binding protein FerR (iron transport regulator)